MLHLHLGNFKWVEETSEFNENFVKRYNDEIDEGYFLEVDVQYLEILHNIYNDFHLLPEIMKTEKVKKLVANLCDKGEYVIHIGNLKQALNHGLVLRNMHRIIEFNLKV